MIGSWGLTLIQGIGGAGIGSNAGLSAVPLPIFSVNLTHVLIPELATGSATPTFTRATTATVVGYGPAAVSGDAMTLQTVLSGEARFQGARRVSPGNYSTVFAKAKPYSSTDGQYGVLQGVTNSYFSTPDSALVSITGDISGVAYIAPNSWAPGSIYVIMGKWLAGTNQRSFLWYIKTDGALELNFSATGGAGQLNTSTVATGFSPGKGKWLLFTRAYNNGAGGSNAYFYTSDDGVNWTQLGGVATGPTDTLTFDSTSPFVVGASNDGTALNLAGVVYRARLYSGIYGSGTETLAAEFNPADYSTGTTFVSSTTGETWTINGSADIVADSAVPIPDSQLDGYLAEGQRTNLVQYSEDFTAAPWTASGGQTVAKDVTGPDGVANSATTITWTTTADTRRQNVTKTSGATITTSIWLKEGNTSHTSMQNAFSGGVAKDSYAVVTWATKTVSVAGADAANLTATIDGPYGDGWYRVTATHVDTGANTSVRIAVFASSSAVANLVTGTVLCFGGQVEEAAFASTYIATTTGSVTRNADVLTYPSSGNILAAEGTIVFEFTPSTADVTIEKTFWSSYLDGSNFLRVGMTNALYLHRVVGGASTATYSAITPVPGTTMKVGARWSPVTGLDIFLNGVKGTNNPDTTTPVLGSTMQVGAWNSALHSFAAQKNLRIYNRALSDAQLQGLTS